MKQWRLIPVTKFKFLKNIPATELWSHFYGMVGFIGLMATIIIAIFGFPGEDEASQGLINSLTIIIGGFMICFLIIYVYFSKELKKASISTQSAKELEVLLIKRERIALFQAQGFHSINHYFRNIIHLMEQTIESDTEDLIYIEKVTDRIWYYLINLTSNLSNLYTLQTEDQCAVTIKLLNNDGIKAKTFFRDPISLKRRRSCDGLYDNPKGIYAVSNNTAFSRILSKDYTDVYYVNDQLGQSFEQKDYHNSNRNWSSFYNATLVAPICLTLSGTKRHFIGFITVDNFKGGFSYTEPIESLMAIGDLLYTFFIKFEKFNTFANSKNYKDDRLKNYNEWD